MDPIEPTNTPIAAPMFPVEHPSHTTRNIGIAVIIFAIVGAGAVATYLYLRPAASQTREATTTTPAVALEKINGIEVPPEPDATLNNQTVAGIDSNNNGVRDDVERHIAIESHSQAEYTNALAIARAYQKIMTTPSISQSQYDIEFQSIVCANVKATPELNNSQIKFYVADSEARKNAYKTNIRGILGNIYPTDDCPVQ